MFIFIKISNSFYCFIKEIVISASLSLLPTSTAMDYIFKSTDVCNISERDVPRFDITHNKSEQSELETGSMTDDCNIYLMILFNVSFSIFFS